MVFCVREVYNKLVEVVSESVCLVLGPEGRPCHTVSDQKGICLIWAKDKFSEILEKINMKSAVGSRPQHDLSNVDADNLGHCLFFGIHRNSVLSEAEWIYVHNLFLQHGVNDAVGTELPFPSACAYKNKNGTYTVCC